MVAMTAKKPEPLALRPREAAQALGVSERTLWTLTREGKIPVKRIGRVTLYPVHRLREWLDGNMLAASEPSKPGRIY